MTTSILDHCPECDGQIARVHPIADTRIGRRSIPVHREFLQCQGECREAYFALGEGDEEWRRAADIGRADDRLLTPQEICDIRRHHDLAQQQLERLLNLGPKTVVRWE